MGIVFLSYADQDRQRARTVAKELELAGHTVWWELEVPPAATFGQFVEETFKHCQCVVVLWTRSSVRDDGVVFEAAKAKEAGVLLSVLLEDVASLMPLEFSRLPTANLSEWRPTLPSKEWDAFLHEVGERAGEGAPVPEKAGGGLSRSLALFGAVLVGVLAIEVVISRYFDGLHPAHFILLALAAGAVVYWTRRRPRD